MTLEDYINSVVNTPWTPRNHCWRLAAGVLKRYFDAELPLVKLPKTPDDRHRAFHERPERLSWTRVRRPAHGALVLMSQSASQRLDEHAGVLLMMPSPLVLHSDVGHGVVVDDLVVCRQRGWHPEFYQQVAGNAGQVR